MHGSTHHSSHRILVIATCLALITFLYSAAAQAPTPVHSMAFTTVREHTLYIRGGRTSDGSVVNQFYALDLTAQSWDTANPPWKKLSLGANNSTNVLPSYHALSVSQDQQDLTVWITGGFKSDYIIRNDAWTPVSRTSASASSKGSLRLSAHSGFQAVTDPTTGLVYVPGGNQNNMLVYNPTNYKITTVSMPQALDYPYWANYSFVWSQSTRTFFFFGGKKIHGSYSTPGLWEYSPSTKSWTSLQSSGSIPSSSTSSCMISAHNGTKIILFGGKRGGVLLGDLHILDVRTRIWTLERGVDPSDNRADMACSVSGDNFIVWGGKLSKTSNLAGRSLGTPLIFNLRSKRWTTRFVQQEANVAMSSLSKRDLSSDLGIWGILGIVGGVVLVISFCCLYLTALRWNIEEKVEMRQKALDGLQQKVPQYDVQNTGPVELLPISADKMEICGAPAGVVHGQTSYTGPNTEPKEESPQELARQIRVMQAELERLQSKLDR